MACSGGAMLFLLELFPGFHLAASLLVSVLQLMKKLPTFPGQATVTKLPKGSLVGGTTSVSLVMCYAGVSNDRRLAVSAPSVILFISSTISNNRLSQYENLLQKSFPCGFHSTLEHHSRFFSIFLWNFQEYLVMNITDDLSSSASDSLWKITEDNFENICESALSRRIEKFSDFRRG